MSSFVAEDVGQMGLFRGQAGYLGHSSSSHPTKSLSSRPPTRRPLPLASSISIMSENLGVPRSFGPPSLELLFFFIQPFTTPREETLTISNLYEFIQV